MKKLRHLLSYTTATVLAGAIWACSTKDEYSSRPIDNFNALWTILDEHYSYFDLKLQGGTTWRDIYDKYRPDIKEQMSTDELFNVLNKMLRELKDGHVNLITPFDYGRYWDWSENYPDNYDPKVSPKYLGDDYRIAGGIRYSWITYNGHQLDSIGLLRYNSFSDGLSSSNLTAAMSRLRNCKALIIDIRDNSGGNVTTSDVFAGHFMNEPRTVGFMRHKTGKGHNDFSELIPIKVKPVESGLRWLRPTVVLTNRGVYSAANDFILKMKGLPYVTIMGDTTGGGGGLPMTSELPNGWAVRYSSTQTFDSEGNHIEYGISPDYVLALNKSQLTLGRDSMIEDAILYINQRYAEYKVTKRWRK